MTYSTKISQENLDARVSHTLDNDLPLPNIQTTRVDEIAVIGNKFVKDGDASVKHIRKLIRCGSWTSHTSGLASDHVQGNVVILPGALASDFLLYCQRNPKPCPLLAVSEAGDSKLPTLGTDIDICSDLPRYRVWHHGKVIDEPINISSLWRKDLVTFVIGCSFSFEQALLEIGLPLRHIEQGKNVAMYRSNIQTQAAGKFNGPMVVSMRPMKAADAIRAVQVTSRFPDVHGAPVHLGDPKLIGISDLNARLRRCSRDNGRRNSSVLGMWCYASGSIASSAS